MLKLVVQSFGYNIIIVWILFILAPCYILISVALSRMMTFLYVVAKNQTSFIYNIFGDISWLLPFKREKDITLTHILLLANLIALISLLVIGTMFWIYYSENQEKKLKEKLEGQKKRADQKKNQ